MILSVLNIRSTMGWAARAYEKGLKVSSAPSFFGVEKHIVKDGLGGVVMLSQGVENQRKLDTEGFSEAQIAIVRSLRDCGLIADHPDLGTSPNDPLPYQAMNTRSPASSAMVGRACFARKCRGVCRPPKTVSNTALRSPLLE